MCEVALILLAGMFWGGVDTIKVCVLINIDMANPWPHTVCQKVSLVLSINCPDKLGSMEGSIGLYNVYGV